MPGLVPGIHVLIAEHSKDVNGRDKPGHDENISKINVRWYNARFPGGCSTKRSEVVRRRPGIVTNAVQ
jgi:hypothetical protein